MKHRGTKILSLLLTLVMMLGLLPGMSLTALAYDGNPYASLVGTTNSVTFNGKPWYIIADNSTAVDAGTVTLLAADTSFGYSKFSSNSSNSYSNSTVKASLDALTTSGSFKDVADAIVGGQLYLLSKNEAKQLSSDVLKMNFRCQVGGWWLRSPGTENTNSWAAYVWGQNGYVDTYGNNVFVAYGVRPALKLKLSSVIFDSESKSFTLKSAGYSVTLSGGANATTSGGATRQTGLTDAMTPVTYTADSGNKFPKTSELYTTTNGITVARTSDTVVTVSGKPTANVNITVPDAAAIPTYTVTYVANNGTEDKRGPNTMTIPYTVEGNMFAAPDGMKFVDWLVKGTTTHYTEGTKINSVSGNLELVAQWESVNNGGNQGGQNSQGGDVVFYGGFGGGDESWSGGYVTGLRAYRVSLAPMQGGSAILILNTGESGTELSVYPQTTVMVIPSPAPGYKLASIVWSLIDGSASYDITQSQNFVMPAMDAVVHVTFVPQG